MPGMKRLFGTLASMSIAALIGMHFRMVFLADWSAGASM